MWRSVVRHGFGRRRRSSKSATAPGCGRVQGGDATGHRDRDAVVGVLERRAARRPCPRPPRRGTGRRPRAGRRSSSFASPSSAAIHTPRSFSSSSARTRFVTIATGRCSSAPADAFSAAAVTGAARRRGTIDPVRSGSFARTCEGAEVLRVGDSVHGDEQRRLTCCARTLEQVVDRRVREARSRRRDHALRVAALAPSPRARGAGSRGRATPRRSASFTISASAPPTRAPDATGSR